MENTENSPLPLSGSKTGGAAYTLTLFIYLIFSVAAGLLILALKLSETDSAAVYISYLAAPLAIGTAGAIVLCSKSFSRRFGKITFFEACPVKTKIKYYVIGILIIFGLMFSLGWINDVTVKFFKLFGYKERESSSYFPNVSGGLIVPALLVIAVLPAVAEEFLFRGIILNSIEKDTGSIRAVFICGFLFSLFHASPEQTVYQFLAGCAFALLALRSRSILPTVLIHFINNATIVIFQACRLLDDGNLIITDEANVALIAVGAVSLTVGVLHLIFDKGELKKHEKGSVKTLFLYLSPAVAILGIIWLLSLFGVA